MVGSTVRRAVAVADSLRHNTMDDMPSWGPVVLALTIFAFLALLMAVSRPSQPPWEPWALTGPGQLHG